MANFDPDAYLGNSNSGVSNKSFDPDAYLKSFEPKPYESPLGTDSGNFFTEVGKAGKYIGKEAVSNLESLGRGAVTGTVAGLPSLLGIPGSIVEGLNWLERKTGMENSGRTYLPTMGEIYEPVATGARAIGGAIAPERFVSETPETEGFKQIGEAVAVPVPGAGALKTVSKAAKTISEARGKPLEKTLNLFKISAEDVAKASTVKSLERESEAVRDTYETARRQGINLESAALKRANEIQNAREESARKFADLGKPGDTATLGDEMQRRLTGTQFTRGARREQQASRDYGEYFKQAEGFENSSARDVMLKRLESMAQDPSAGSAGRKYAENAFKDLSESKNAMGAEKEFRKYFEQASAPQQAGYGAVEQAANRAVSDIISEGLNTHAPLRVEVRNTYKEFSTPLDAYETQFGKQALATEKAMPGQVQMMPTDYPKQYFQNRDTIRVLREQLAGDEAAVRKFANQHVVNELKGKNATQAQEWLTKNREWLNEVEGLNARTQRYISNLVQTEAKEGTLAQQIEKITKRRGTLSDIRQKKEVDISKAGEADREFIKTEIRSVKEANPKQLPDRARTLIDALEKRKLISPEQRSEYISQIESIEKMSTNKEQAAKRIKQVLTGFGILGTLEIGAGKFGYGIRKSLGF